MTKCEISVEPLFNRVVIFTIGEDSLHGHPIPLNTPEDKSRNSIALYYFTEEKPEEIGEHTVIFYKTQ
jgi:hypothetical protein